MNKQRSLLQAIVESSGQKIDQSKLNDALTEINERQPRNVEELQEALEQFFPDSKMQDFIDNSDFDGPLMKQECCIDNSDLDGLLDTLGGEESVGVV